MSATRKKVAILLACITTVLLAVNCAQIPGLGGSGLSGLMSREPITTSLKDAQTEIPYMDDFKPQRTTPLTSLARGQNNGFVLQRPGFYSMTAASY